MILILILWLLAGYCAWRCRYYGMIKSWYNTFKEDYRDYKDGSALSFWRFVSPLVILGGLVSLITGYCLDSENWCWNFKIPK